MAKTQKRSKKQIFLQKLERQIQDFLSTTGFEQIGTKKLIHALDLPRSQEELVREALDNLVAKEIIRHEKNGYRIAAKAADIVTGILRMHPRGFGFLQTDGPGGDIFIPKSLTQNAIDGDKVEVMINQQSASTKGPEGKVLNILHRARSHLAGTVHKVFPDGHGLAYAPLLGIQQSVLVEPEDFTLRVGDRIVMQVQKWGEEGDETVCIATHRIGHISDPSVDVAAAVEEYELKTTFSVKAIQEAKKFGKQVREEDLVDRQDFRQVETFTIDPTTAKDFDDALSLSQDSKGNYHLAVHIADVSYYVTPGSALDAEAFERCNSTYFPGTCIPMLPPELSENLCSLKPNEDRLTLSVLATFDKDGNQLNYKITRGVIHSAKRFTYREAKEVLDGTLESPHLKTLKLMVTLCGLLKKKRYERGSIEFAMPELVVLVDAKGAPTGTDVVEYDITHQLVEEFMLKANEIVATHLTEAKKNLAYRVHDEPSADNLKDFASICAAFGFQLSETPKPSELQAMFHEVASQPYGEFLATSYIRRMRMAIYSADNIGHYGLMLSHYCHFTSPIRRYVDLTVHRVVLGESDNREMLSSVAQLCSEQERISGRAEANVVQLKKLRLLSEMKKKDTDLQFDAIVTHVKPFGVFFEVVEFMLEGFIHISDLADDFYRFDDENMTLKGQSHGKIYHAGDKMAVMLGSVDLILQESKWHLVDNAPKRRKRRR